MNQLAILTEQRLMGSGKTPCPVIAGQKGGGAILQFLYGKYPKSEYAAPLLQSSVPLSEWCERRGCVRLHEKGGTEHEAPCVPQLEQFLYEYIAAAGIAADQDGALFLTTGQFTGKPHRMTLTG